ncbi:type Z 30S ribosomal protein S14 [Patescibacteria group bacterium]|nr:type Z 30S ribosomal protein S14 [Patescibacteria group bacterium]
MAREALIVKANKKPKYSTRIQRRCFRCGRIHSVYRQFGLCRLCLRESIHRAEIPGVKKASW